MPPTLPKIGHVEPPMPMKTPKTLETLKNKRHPWEVPQGGWLELWVVVCGHASTTNSHVTHHRHLEIPLHPHCDLEN